MALSLTGSAWLWWSASSRCGRFVTKGDVGDLVTGVVWVPSGIGVSFLMFKQ